MRSPGPKVEEVQLVGRACSTRSPKTAFSMLQGHVSQHEQGSWDELEAVAAGHPAAEDQKGMGGLAVGRRVTRDGGPRAALGDHGVPAVCLHIGPCF